MLRAVILIAAIAPPLLVLGYGIAKSRARWNSEAIWTAFLVGAVGALAAAACEYVLDLMLQPDRMSPLAGAAVSASLLAAIPEEAVKFFVLVHIAEKHIDIGRFQDRLVLALAVSLGFATLENFFYVIEPADWTTVASVRAITAVPGHGIDGLAMGAFLMARRMTGRAKPAYIRNALLVPIVLHAAYDFPLFALERHLDRMWFGAAWLLVLVASSAFVITLCNRLLAEAVDLDEVSGRDGDSVETTDRLIVGGIAAVIGGPLLAATAFYAGGTAIASVGTVLSIFPIALGIDAIRTGLKRRRLRRERRLDAGLPLSLSP
jgi:protease PrsW